MTPTPPHRPTPPAAPATAATPSAPGATHSVPAARGVRLRNVAVALTALGIAAATWGLAVLAQVAPGASDAATPLQQAPGEEEEAEAAESAVARLLPPLGVVAEARLNTVELAWVANPRSAERAQGYDVLYWPETDAGFALRKRLHTQPQPGQRALIAGLAPGTAYYVSVRAATRTLLPELERRGDWSLSALSPPVRVETRPNPSLRLVGAIRGEATRAYFTLGYVDPDSGREYQVDAVGRAGEEIRGRIVLDERERILASGYELVRAKRIPYWPLAEHAANGWHTLLQAGGDAPRDELDGDHFELRLPLRTEPLPPAPRTRDAVIVRHIATGKERLLIAIKGP